VPNAESLIKALHDSGGAAVCHGQTLAGLDLRGRQLDASLNLSRGTSFDAGLNARRSQVEGDLLLSQARFAGPVDLSWARVHGRVYAWRARFHADATFRQLMVAPGQRADTSYVHPGEVNFSWAWFHGPACFERCHFEGPAYFWRTRFLDRCSFDETSFAKDATFMGMPSEVCLSRREIGWDFFSRLEALGLVRRDDEEVATVDGRECAMFGQLAGVRGVQELQQRMAEVGLAKPECAALAAQYREHCGPMFAGAASLQRLRIAQPRQVKFVAVNGLTWDLAGTDLDAIAFFDAEQHAVPANVGLGHAYDGVFISYGGLDQAVAARLNRALQNVGVDTFYYPENSIPGRVIDREMVDGVAGFDRVLLICSQTSPLRPGWRFELQRTLEREDREGEGTVLVIAAIDEGLWRPWPAEVEAMRLRLQRHTVVDFRGALDNTERFNSQLGRVLAALHRPD
jgi:hypothetical protein